MNFLWTFLIIAFPYVSYLQTCGQQDIQWSHRNALPYVQATLMEVQRHSSNGISWFWNNLTVTNTYCANLEVSQCVHVFCYPHPDGVTFYIWLLLRTLYWHRRKSIAPPEVYIGNRLQQQYAGVWSVSIGIHHGQWVFTRGMFHWLHLAFVNQKYSLL